MQRNIAKGSTIQQCLPDAIQPKYTGKLPTIEPTKVFHYVSLFMRVQINKQLPQMAAPTPATIGPQVQSPPIPARPRAIPLARAYLGFRPSTRGRWHVLFIWRSYSISMYWLRVWVDMERAVDDRKSGRAAKGVGQRAKLAVVTSPLRTDNLNLVSYMYCFRYLAREGARIGIMLLLLLQKQLWQIKQWWFHGGLVFLGSALRC